MAALIAAQRDQHRIPCAVSCRALGVSRSWHYKQASGRLPPRAERRRRLAAEVKRLFELHEGKYGSPRITADLRDAGWRVSENTVAAVMRELGLAAWRKRRRKSTTRPGCGRWRAPDLVNCDFPAEGINQKWLGDGTEIPTGEGKLHLASLLGIAPRGVVGSAPSEHHDAQLAYGALAMAVAVRGRGADVILHPDQGSEYTADTFRAACGRLGICQSMGRLGAALDNAAIEAWRSPLESELRRLERFATEAAARAKVVAWIDDYNRQRRHSALGMLTPVAYEQRLAAAKEAARS